MTPSRATTGVLLVRRWFTAPVLASLAVSLVGFVLKAQCASTGWGAATDTYLKLCYSDAGPLYVWRGFESGVIPYFQSYQGQFLEYPVLTGVLMFVVSEITRAIAGQPDMTVFVYLTWLTSAAFTAVAVALLERMHTGNRLAPWLLACSPAVLLVLGINWDAGAVLATIASLYFFERNQDSATAIAIAIGAATKLFPALIVVPVIAVSLSNNEVRRGMRIAAQAAAVFAFINLPFALFAREGWLTFFEFSRTRGVDFGSLALAARYLAHTDFTVSEANAFGLIAVGLATALVFALRNRIDVYAGSFLVIAAFAVSNKVYSPQYWLWLTAVLALTSVSVRVFAAWNFAQAIYFIAIWRYLLHLTDASVAGGINERHYALAILIAAGSTLAVMGFLTFREHPDNNFGES